MRGAEKSVEIEFNDKASVQESVVSSVRRGNGANKFSFPPDHYLWHNSSWKPCLIPKHPPGHAHAMRTKLTTKLKKPIPEKVCEDIRDALGSELYTLLAQSINLEPAGQARPSTTSNTRRSAQPGTELPDIAPSKTNHGTSEDGKMRKPTIYERVWRGSTLENVDMDSLSEKLKSENKRAMRHVPVQGLKGAPPQHKSMFPFEDRVFSFDQWFKNYGAVKSYKIPQAKLMKHGLDWHPRMEKNPRAEQRRVDLKSAPPGIGDTAAMGESMLPPGRPMSVMANR